MNEWFFEYNLNQYKIRKIKIDDYYLLYNSLVNNEKYYDIPINLSIDYVRNEIMNGVYKSSFVLSDEFNNYISIIVIHDYDIINNSFQISLHFMSKTLVRLSLIVVYSLCSAVDYWTSYGFSTKNRTIMRYMSNKYSFSINNINNSEWDLFIDNSDIQVEKILKIRDKNMKSIKINASDIGNSTISEHSYPDLSLVNMIMTRRCNYDCDYCVEDKDQLNIPDWTVESFHELIIFCAEQSKTSVVLSFFGGEPFLKWKLMKEMLEGSIDILNYYNNSWIDKGRVFSINISTNGFLMTDEKLKWLSDWMDRSNINVEFLLSIDTFSNDTVRVLKDRDRETGQDVIYDNLINLSNNYSKMMDVSCFRLSVVPELLTHVIPDVERMIDMKPLNIIIHPVTTEDPNEDLWTNDLWTEFVDSVNESSMYALMNGNVIIECMEGVSIKGGNCGAGTGMLGADSSGDLYSCYFTAHEGDKNDVVANFKSKKSFSVGMDYINIKYDDPACDTCKTTYCHQCHIKNISHKNKKFCSASWCKEIADVYSRTLTLCDLTYVNHQESGRNGLDIVTFHEKIQCSINSIAGFLKASIEGVNDWMPKESCGCEKAEGSIVEAVRILADLNLLKFTARNLMLGEDNIIKESSNKWLKH